MSSRPDGRTSGTSLRPLSCQLHSLSRADGSAHWTSGSTSILAAVYGPLAPKIPSRERLDQGFVQVVFKHSKYHPSKSQSIHSMADSEIERWISDTLTACIDLKQYPRTGIEVVLLVMQADGSVLPCALNAAVVALMDAGVALKSIPVGTSCWMPRTVDGIHPILLDPSGEEEDDKEQGGTLVLIAMDSVNESIITCTTLGSGSWDPSSLSRCIEAAQMASKAVVMFMRMAMEQSNKMMS